jgi:hypothetical protein
VEERQPREQIVSAGWVFDISKILNIREDTENSDRTEKCGSSLAGKSLHRTELAPSAKGSSRTTPTLFPTTSIPEVWAERGETIIRTIFRLYTGGATGRRDRAEAEVGSSVA